MASHLIYHPKRQRRVFGQTTVYFDKTSGNQDPYVWNRAFLHSYCHITELQAPATDDIQFWVCGDQFPIFEKLYCDLVFWIESVNVWQERNTIDPNDPLIDSSEAYVDHYRWAHEHEFKKRRRRTLKAHPTKSFQPQLPDGSLIDIVPMLVGCGTSLDSLRDGLRKAKRSKPFPLHGQIGKQLYDLIDKAAPIKVAGSTLQDIRLANPSLASKDKRSRGS